MKNSKVIVSVLGIIVLVGGLFAGMYAVSQRQILERGAVPATTLNFATTATPVVGDTFDVTVETNTNSNQIIGVELYLTFDSTRLQANSISLGSFWGGNAQVQTSSIGDGTITYVIFLPPGATPIGPNVEDSVASINFTALAEGEAALGFANGTLIAGVGEGDTGVNLLDVAIPTTLMIQTEEASPTPTAPPDDPTATPTATSTLAPTVTATNSPTATLSPTPTTGSGGGATNTPTPTSVATNSPTPTTGSGGGTNTPTSASNGSSALRLAITNLTVGQILTDNTPTFRGTAPSGSVVSLTVESDPVTGSTTTDASGNWSWTVPAADALEDGSHTVTASSGGDSVSVNFSVNTSGSLPDAGVSTPTLIGFGLGFIILLLAAGLFAL